MMLSGVKMEPPAARAGLQRAQEQRLQDRLACQSVRLPVWGWRPLQVGRVYSCLVKQGLRVVSTP